MGAIFAQAASRQRTQQQKGR